MPEYDVWFNGTWAKTWGEKNDVQVDIDHLYYHAPPSRWRRQR